MNFWERIYLPAIVKGLGITIRHYFKKKPTVKYPEQERPYSKNFRGQHSLKRDELGRERCTACGLCALSCPAEAITMTAAERKKAKSTCIEKRNMRRFTKSICCVVFSVVYVRKLARKRQSI